MKRTKRECWIGEDGYCHVPLQNGEEAICNSEFIAEINKHSWYLNNDGYAKSRINKSLIPLHRFIFLLKYLKIDDGLMVDHISRRKMDNRLENLRLATNEENARNTTRGKNFCGYRGVKKDKNKYNASIFVSGKKIHIGNFNSPSLAAYFYDVWAFHYHKEFCVLNFPDKIEEYKLKTPERFNYKLESTSSKFFWVCFFKSRNKFVARIKIDGKCKHIGYFNDEVSAAKSADLFIIKNNLNLKLNFPKETYEQELNQEKQMIVFKTN